MKQCASVSVMSASEDLLRSLCNDLLECIMLSLYVLRIGLKDIGILVSESTVVQGVRILGNES
jgi:hypothetical protein